MNTEEFRYLLPHRQDGFGLDELVVITSPREDTSAEKSSLIPASVT